MRRLAREHLVRVVVAEHHGPGDQVVRAATVRPGEHEDERYEQGDKAQDAIRDAPDHRDQRLN